MRYLFFMVFVFFSFTNSSIAGALDYKSNFVCDTNKFNWYCDEAEKEAIAQPVILAPVEQKPVTSEQPKIEIGISKKEKSKKEIEVEKFDALKQELEDLRKVFYMNPSSENAYAYIDKQNEVTQKASVFTDVWKRTLWSNPELDYSQKHPVATMAKNVKSAFDDHQKVDLAKQLSDDGGGLMFFYRSDCEYCHAMIEPLKHLYRRTGINIMSISLDGKLIDGLPNNRLDAGQGSELQVKVTPSIYVANPRTRDIKLLTAGWVAAEELLDRFYITLATKPGENY